LCLGVVKPQPASRNEASASVAAAEPEAYIRQASGDSDSDDKAVPSASHSLPQESTPVSRATIVRPIESHSGAQ